MLARACLVLALLGGGSALAGCTDPGLVGEVMPLSTTPTTCSSDMECGAGKRCDEHTCVACEGDECEPPAETDSGCGQADAACAACMGDKDCSNAAQPFCAARTCVACREDDDCTSHKCEHGVCDDDDDVAEHQDVGAAGSDDSSGAGSMSDGEAGEGDGL